MTVQTAPMTEHLFGLTAADAARIAKEEAARLSSLRDFAANFDVSAYAERMTSAFGHHMLRVSDISFI